MTEEQLQLLRSLRPQGQDEHEAGVPEARAAAEDAGLTGRLDHERENDLVMRGALGQVEPPAGLENSLRIAMRAARGIGEPPAELRESVLSAVRLPRTAAPAVRQSRRRWLGWGVGIAASLAVGGKWWWDTQAFTLRRLTGALTAITRQGITLDLMSMDKVAVGDWLAANKAPRLAALPAKLNELPRKGCHLYDVEGRPVSLECFLLPEMQQLHLYTTPSAGLVNPPASRAGVVISQDGDLTLATWAAEDQTLLLVSHEAPELVRSLIG
ncbi:MAG: hypothetical protein ACRCXD_04125 [Luteolibacter sp.]